MTAHQLVYLVFGILLTVALVIDLGVLSKKNKIISIKAAMKQTVFWVMLALSFFVFLLFEGKALAADEPTGKEVGTYQLAFEFLSAYLMEWSLSIDNIFVFILIFSSFNVKEKHYPRVLLIGILMAIIFRIAFITIGVALVARFHWVLYIFGAFLIYTGYKMYTAEEDAAFDPHDSKIYRFLKRFAPCAARWRWQIGDSGKWPTSVYHLVCSSSAVSCHRSCFCTRFYSGCNGYFQRPSHYLHQQHFCSTWLAVFVFFT